jgi:hypothetical protein
MKRKNAHYSPSKQHPIKNEHTNPTQPHLSALNLLKQFKSPKFAFIFNQQLAVTLTYYYSTLNLKPTLILLLQFFASFFLLQIAVFIFYAAAA